MKATITITYGDQAENHKGMQIIGERAPTGLTAEEMDALAARLTALELKVEHVRLGADASVLVIRNGINMALGSAAAANEMYAEQMALPWDSKALMYGRVVNKKARHNLCFGHEPQEPDYAAGRGRIVPWARIPRTDALRAWLTRIHPKFARLVAEGNLYYDPKTCGIGYHGDTERRIVIAARLGVSIPLVYLPFHSGKPTGPPIALTLNHGDIYIMSEKATGHDWKSPSLHTWRHAAGAPAYTTPPAGAPQN